MTLALALLASCASPPYWERTWEGATSIDVRELSAFPWPDVQGVTYCDKPARHCTILIRAGVDRACVEAHERRHAAGFDHPDYRLNLACQ